VAARRDGKFVYYGLADDAVLDLVAALHRIAERNVAEVGRVLESYFRDRDSLEPVSREELLQRSRAGTVTVLDGQAACGSALPRERFSPLTQREQRGAGLLTCHSVIFWKVCNRGQEGSCRAVNIIGTTKRWPISPMDREGTHIGGQSRYRALSLLLGPSGGLQPSVKSNDCWNRKASAVEPPAGTVP
jgi:hypothetical protein